MFTTRGGTICSRDVVFPVYVPFRPVRCGQYYHGNLFRELRRYTSRDDHVLEFFGGSDDCEISLPSIPEDEMAIMIRGTQLAALPRSAIIGSESEALSEETTVPISSSHDSEQFRQMRLVLQSHSSVQATGEVS
jgi:hypothetical protein